MSFNKIILIGNLGRDPELRYTPQGDAVCNFSVAVNDKKRDKAGELQDVTTWFRITLWRKMAENASKYLTKGNPVYIEGRLKVDEWQDRDGKDRYTLDVTATDMHFLGSSRSEEFSGGDNTESFSQASGGGDAGSSTSANQTVDSSSPNDDDIPF